MNARIDLPLRQLLKQVYELNWKCFAKPIEASELSASAIVFAPHQDDETLACGGTIIQKKRLGASVQIVYLTDGSESHPNLIDPKHLCEIREQEAIAAVEILGVSSEDVTFLRFPDGQLAAHTEAAIAQIAEILLKHQPAEIFIPHQQEPDYIPDHSATYRIVSAAVQRAKMPLRIYEYPVWLWDHYPWVCYKRVWSGKFRWYRSLCKTLSGSCHMGWILLHDFRYCVDIQADLDLKYKALTQYQSQTTQYIADPRWRTIVDFSNGDFLRCFFRDQEFFYRRDRQ
jgi:LmbE family N-acetylglucosaminyl deacetylase